MHGLFTERGLECLAHDALRQMEAMMFQSAGVQDFIEAGKLQTQVLEIENMRTLIGEEKKQGHAEKVKTLESDLRRKVTRFAAGLDSKPEDDVAQTKEDANSSTLPKPDPRNEEEDSLKNPKSPTGAAEGKLPELQVDQEQKKLQMNLRNILKKDEKPKRTLPVYDPSADKDFANGSQSTTPFLLFKKDDSPSNTDKLGARPSGDETAETGNSSMSAYSIDGAANEKKSETSNLVDSEITVTPTYTEEEFRLWKSLSTLGSNSVAATRPSEILPLTVSPRRNDQKEKRMNRHSQVGHNRPAEWISPTVKPRQSYTIKTSVKLIGSVAGIELEDDGNYAVSL